MVAPSNMGLSSNDHYLIGLQLIHLDLEAIFTFSPLKNDPKSTNFQFFFQKSQFLNIIASHAPTGDPKFGLLVLKPSLGCWLKVDGQFG